MTFNINDFIANLPYGGARPTLFEVTIQNPVNGAADIKVPFMVKAASIPPSTVGIIEQKFQGRTIKLPGDRTFAEWQVTVINDEDFAVRDALEAWSNAINTLQGNVGAATPISIKSQAQVSQFSKSGEILRTYQFEGLWPSEIGQIDLDFSSSDTIEEFTVQFQYDSYKVSGGTTGDGGGA